jgi:hypothetical protein
VDPAVILTWPLANLADVQQQLERAAGSSERNAKYDRDPTSPPPEDTDQQSLAPIAAESTSCP